MKIMFWNVHKNTSINEYISSLVQDYKIDMLVLAEYKAESIDLINRFRRNGDFMEEYLSIGSERLRFFGNYKDVEPSTQNKYYSIQIINKELILCGVHLPSDLHGDKSRERAARSRVIIQDIQENERQLSTQKTIIVGDFNEMPYSEGCLNADAFHGLPAYENSRKEYRTVLGNNYN